MPDTSIRSLRDGIAARPRAAGPVGRQRCRFAVGAAKPPQPTREQTRRESRRQSRRLTAVAPPGTPTPPTPEDAAATAAAVQEAEARRQRETAAAADAAKLAAVAAQEAGVRAAGVGGALRARPRDARSGGVRRRMLESAGACTKRQNAKEAHTAHTTCM